MSDQKGVVHASGDAIVVAGGSSRGGPTSWKLLQDRIVDCESSRERQRRNLARDLRARAVIGVHRTEKESSAEIDSDNSMGLLRRRGGRRRGKTVCTRDETRARDDA